MRTDRQFTSDRYIVHQHQTHALAWNISSPLLCPYNGVNRLCNAPSRLGNGEKVNTFNQWCSLNGVPFSTSRFLDIPILLQCELCGCSVLGCPRILPKCMGRTRLGITAPTGHPTLLDDGCDLHLHLVHLGRHLRSVLETHRTFPVQKRDEIVKWLF